MPRAHRVFQDGDKSIRRETVDHNLGNFLIVIVVGHNAQPVLIAGRRYSDVIGGYPGVGLPQPIEDKCVSSSRSNRSTAALT